MKISDGTLTHKQLAELILKSGVEAGPFLNLAVAVRKRLGLDVEKNEEPTRRGAAGMILDDLLGKLRR